MFLTYKYRIKDKRAAKRLAAHAFDVNQVWNYLCETQRRAETRYKSGGPANKWPSAYDFAHLCAGASQLLSISADTIGEVCQFFVRARTAKKRCPRFRASFGPRRALGWVPYRGTKKRSIRIDGDSVTYLKERYRFWLSREIGGEVKSGAFVQDARGRWYVTFQCEIAEERAAGAGEIGIDLGLKALATCSNGVTIPALQHYRRYEAALSTAERAGNRRRAKAINAKITNSRRHHLHEWSTKIVRENSLVVVGDVNAASLKQTKMGKSISDAGWSMFRGMLRYKCQKARSVFVEADERNTSVTCSECGCLSGPKGQKGLRIRHWKCDDCGASHDRDVNAARNILRVGLECQPREAEIAA